MPIHLEFTLTLDDYLDAARLHSEKSSDQVITPIWGVAIILIALLTLIWSGPDMPFMILMGLGLFFGAYPFYRRFRLKRLYTQTRIGAGDQVIDLDETNIRMRARGVKDEIEWNAVRTFVEGKNAFLLYLAPAKFISIPKRVCTVEQKAELRKLFAERLGSDETAGATL